jgi:FkbM family methyltransferase
MMLPFAELFSKYKMNIKGAIHLGANMGQEAELYDSLFNGEVIWVEALPFVFDKLRENIAKYPKQTAIKACLSDVDGQTVAFNISDNEAQSSSMLEFGVHETIHPDVHFIDCVALKTIRFDTLFNLIEKNIDKLNFLNLDLQGAELLALKGMGKYLNNIEYIITEVNAVETYKGCALISDLDEFLKDFTRVETGTLVGGAWSDALYIRTSLL